MVLGVVGMAVVEVVGVMVLGVPIPAPWTSTSVGTTLLVETTANSTTSAGSTGVSRVGDRGAFEGGGTWIDAELVEVYEVLDVDARSSGGLWCCCCCCW